MTQDTRTDGPRIFVSAGEASGDLHAANLVRALRGLAGGCDFAALGGSHLSAAGARVIFDMAGHLAVMGFADAILKVPQALRVRRETLRFLDEWRPDAAVLVDYPGFNVNLAKFLKRRGVPVFYYICPQVWAWAPWRVGKIGRRIDKALVVFEFEVDFFRRHGINVTYVGHPLGDLFAQRGLDEDFMRNGPLSAAPMVVALVPGSRRKEISGGFPVKAAAAKLIRSERPEAVFAVPVLNDEHAALVRRIASEVGLECEVFVGRTHEVMALSHFALATSGTATLELAHFGTPMVVLYRTNPAGLALKSILLTTEHIALVNILAGRRLVPEFVYWRNHAEIIARTGLDMIGDEKHYEEIKSGMEAATREISTPGASDRAAREILTSLGLL
jgi:lipid-A-disaccharide synthase